MVDALPLAQIVHAIPGRARLRIDARRGDAAFFASVATGLSAVHGVSQIEVRPLTASIIIQHAGPLARISRAAEKARLFVLANSHSAPSPTPAIWIDPKMVAAAGLGVLAIWQLTQGRVLPPAITLAWYVAGLTGFRSNGESADGGE